jgi:hypothetical protein
MACSALPYAGANEDVRLLDSLGEGAAAAALRWQLLRLTDLLVFDVYEKNREVVTETFNLLGIGLSGNGY